MSKNLEPKVRKEVTNSDLNKAISNLAVSTDKSISTLNKSLSDLAVSTDKSISELAAFTARGFENNDTRFDSNDKHFMHVEKRFDKVDSDITYLRVNIKENTRSINILGARLGVRDNEMDELQKEVSDLNKRVKHLERSR